MTIGRSVELNREFQLFLFDHGNADGAVQRQRIDRKFVLPRGATEVHPLRLLVGTDAHTQQLQGYLEFQDLIPAAETPASAASSGCSSSACPFAEEAVM